MTPEDWRRAKSVFEAALAEPSEARGAFVEAACAGDEGLRSAVETLLAADGQSELLVDRVPADELLRVFSENRDLQWLGRTLGAYRIIGKLGEGGMGSVFLAERHDAEFRKTVAVKVVRFGLESEAGVRRFRTERQILANLEHPNIARLIDGGTTDEGLPYLVMEHVDGEPITTYCDRRLLKLPERLELFGTVCDAVQHAHRNLVVHRDLKAGNILVTDDGVPKLLDFGIAKLLEAEGGLAHTVTMTRVLTPDYASPEQLAGRPITTASDVYSLGVLLYELLAGGRPFSWRGRSTAEIERMLLSEQPRPPSVAVGGERDPEAVAATRGSRPEALRRALSGDLDNVVLRALRPEPEERYGSAEQLAADLWRYRTGLPVEARPSGLGYRAGKFVRRHAVASVVVAAAVVLLLSFTVVTLVQSAQIARERDLARHEQARVEGVSGFLGGSLREADPRRAGGATSTAREILETGARRVQQELAGQRELQVVLMHTIGLVYVDLGLYPSAQPLLAGSLELRRELFGDDHPAVAESFHAWGELRLEQGELEEAEEAARQSLAIRRGVDPAGTAGSLHLLGRIRRVAGQRSESISLHEEALEIQRQAVGEEDPAYIEGTRHLATAVRAEGRLEWAEELNRRALALQRELFAGDHPITASLLDDLAVVLREREAFEVADALAREALSMSRRLFPEGHLTTALVLNNLAAISRLEGRAEEARELYLEGLEMRRALLGPEHPRLAGAIYNLALLLHRDFGSPEEAEPLYREAVETQRRTLGEDHPNMAFFSMGLGRVLSDLGRAEEAEPILRRSLESFEQRSKGRNVASARSALAGALLRQRRYGEAEQLLEASYPVLAESYGDDHRITRRALDRMVQLYRETGRDREAARYRAVLESPGS